MFSRGKENGDSTYTTSTIEICEERILAAGHRQRFAGDKSVNQYTPPPD